MPPVPAPGVRGGELEPDDPLSLRTPCPPHLREVVQVANERLRIVFEVTERAVADDPAGLLAAVARVRASGAGIALDDVGAEPASLAMMPIVDPDVVKLDLRLIQERTLAGSRRDRARHAPAEERTCAGRRPRSRRLGNDERP